MSSTLIYSSLLRLTPEIDRCCEQFRQGLAHENCQVSRQFWCSVRIAQRARHEQASESLLAVALLYKSCQMLATGSFSEQEWTSDSLIETGTLDWLSEHFGEQVGELIRLQPYTKRYLAAVSPYYAQRLEPYQRDQLSRIGGDMSLPCQLAFARGRYFTPALCLARWIDQGSSLCLDRFETQPLLDILHRVARVCRNN